MRIIVKAKAGSKKELVEKVTSPDISLFGPSGEMEIYRVSVKEPPVGGRANTAIIRALAQYFDVAISMVRIISGQSAKRKIFEIDDLR